MVDSDGEGYGAIEQISPAIDVRRWRRAMIEDNIARKRIMYWSHDKKPDDFVTDIPAEKKQKAIAVLSSGEPVKFWMGWANCKMCWTRLGTNCVGNDTHMWPEMAEHYVSAHNVWVPELDEIIR